MTHRDGVALAVSVAYVALVLAGSVALRRTRLSARARRSMVHIAVGLWIVPTVVLFDTRWAAMAPPVLFVVANALRRPRRLYLALDERRRLDWGLVFFPASVAVLIGLNWPGPVRVAVVVGALCLAVGDSSAALVGRCGGRLTWKRLLKRADPSEVGKTVEGSAALWVTCAVVTTAAFVWLPPWPAPRALAVGVIVATVALVVEAVTPGRFDNLTLPLVTGGVARLALAWGPAAS